MPLLEHILSNIFKSLNRFVEKREAVIKTTRDIIMISRKAINLIHSNNISDAEHLINQLRDKCAFLLKNVKDEPRLLHSGFVRDSLKEYVEAQLLLSFKKNESINEKNFPTHESLGVTEETFILGLFDFLGELKRVIIGYLRKRYYKKAWETLDFAKKILFQLETTIYADSIIPGYKSRVDGLKRMVVATEELILKIENEDKLSHLISIISEREMKG